MYVVVGPAAVVAEPMDNRCGRILHIGCGCIADCRFEMQNSVFSCHYNCRAYSQPTFWPHGVPLAVPMRPQNI